MIGNDIIDIKLARLERKSKNHRFLKKVFSQSEISMIANSQEPELKLWILWSMKEAAYKSHQRNYQLPRKLNPLAYTCDHFSFQNAGHVRIENEVYFINLQITSEYIHSFTCSGRINWKIYPSSTLPKKELLRQMISDLGYTNEYLEMRKDQNGIPSLHKKNSLKKIPFSLSHHGDFTALSIPLINC